MCTLHSIFFAGEEDKLLQEKKIGIDLSVLRYIFFCLASSCDYYIIALFYFIFAGEKKIVLNQVRGYFVRPERIFKEKKMASKSNRLFFVFLSSSSCARHWINTRKRKRGDFLFFCAHVITSEAVSHPGYIFLQEYEESNVLLCFSFVCSKDFAGTAQVDLYGPSLTSQPSPVTHFSNSVGLTLTCAGSGPKPLTTHWLSSTGEDLPQIPGIR